MTSPYQHLYMAAMALNNMGVSLLERRAEEKAIEMLCLAVVLIRAITKGDSLMDLQLLNTAQTKLAEANQKLASCPLSNHLCDFRVITHHDIFDVVLNSCQGGNKIAGEPSPPVLIQIERMASIVDDEHNYFPGFEFSIVLYNLGTYYLHMASGVGLHVTKALEKRQCACGLFQLSYDVLQMLVHELSVQDHADFKIQYPSFMMQVLQNLVYTNSMLGITTEGDFFNITIGTLYQSLQCEYNTIKLFPLHTARAA